MHLPANLPGRTGPTGLEHEGRPPLRWWWGRHQESVLLLLALGAYFGVLVWLSVLRQVDLQTTTWDMGLYQQALWSTAHGRPFYEAADYETGGFVSLLQVHGSYVLYALVPLYGQFPSQLTLFAVQAGAVALAAVPLFLLAETVIGSRRWALGAAIVYLCWAPVIASNLYDFHAEAFLPVEVFAFVLAWERGRYLAGMAIALVAFATMDIAPVLLFFVGAYFLLPSYSPEPPSRAGRAQRGGSTLQRRLAEWPASIHSPRGYATLGLMAACLVAYGALLEFRYHELSAVLGIAPFPTHPLGYVIGDTPSELGLSLANLGVGFPTKVEAALLWLALLGFVPLLAPRALLLAVPWAAMSFLSQNLNYSALGFQYGFIVASALLVAFVYGLGNLRGAWRVLGAGEGPPTAHSPPRPTPPSERASPRRYRPRHAILFAGLTVLVVVNLLVSPIDPWMDDGAPGSAYRLTYQPPAGYPGLEDLVGLLPPGATVVASDNLFPLVANDVHAYSFLWIADYSLRWPFDPASPPPFVLVAQDRTYAVPQWLVSLLYAPGGYGVRAVDEGTAVGAAFLYEYGYHGPVTSFGASGSLTRYTFGEALGPQSIGIVAPDPQSMFGVQLTSAPGSAGTLSYGPGLDLSAGTWNVTIWLRDYPAYGVDGPSNGSAVFSIVGTAFGEPPLFDVAPPYGPYDSPADHPVRASFRIAMPVMGVELAIYLLDPYAGLSVSYVEWSESASP